MARWDTQQYLAIRRTAHDGIVNITAISMGDEFDTYELSVKLNKWEDREYIMRNVEHGMRNFDHV